ncbi:MAG: DUF2207 domain-containing protein [Thermomicrobiales bacterium]
MAGSIGSRIHDVCRVDRSSSSRVSVRRPDPGADAIRLLLLMTGLAIVSFGFVFLLGIWYLRGRDPYATPLPGSGGRPPGDLPAAVVGSLIDERVDHADLVATSFDLQRRGILTVGRSEQGVERMVYFRSRYAIPRRRCTVSSDRW